MKVITFISDLIIPVTLLTIILFGCAKKVDIYGSFVEGAKEGMKTVIGILPTLIGLMVAVTVLRASGALDILVNFLKPFANIVGFPAEIIPLSLMRLVSSSASTGLLIDLFENYGTDSFIGRLASVMMSCTETVFYTMSVYFMSVNIKNTRYTLTGALIANVVGVIVSFYIVSIFFV